MKIKNHVARNLIEVLLKMPCTGAYVHKKANLIMRLQNKNPQPAIDDTNDFLKEVFGGCKKYAI